MRRTHPSRVLALLACTAVVATAVGYTVLLQQQRTTLGEAPTSPWAALRGAPTWFLVTLAATIAATATAVFLRPSRGRRLLLLGTSAVLLVVGFLAAFSIGAGLLLAAALTFAAASGDKAAREPATPVLR